MTVMLHNLVNLRVASLLALAAAGSVFVALPAAAGTGCNLKDGYAEDLVSYVSEVNVCLGKADRFRVSEEEKIFDLTNSERIRAGVPALERRVSMDQAARAHALDMAERGYAGHSDLEGRGHVYRMRALDRKVLVSATGANVVVLKAGASADEIYSAIRADATNSANLSRDSFTDTGLGVAEKDGNLYVVQMLTRVEGELEQPLPLQFAGTTAFTPKLNEDMFRSASWTLTDASGRRLAGASTMRLSESALAPKQDGYLNLIVEVDQDEYVLRGPAVVRE